MKSNYLKHIFSAALVAAVSLGNVSCINDLDISSIDPQSSSSFDQEGAFVKQYALLGLTGQKGLAGTPDLDGQDEGESGFYRTIFNCQELPTDECVWVWQDNVDIPQFTSIEWNSSSQRTEWVYVRLGYDITQMNFFLDQIAGKTDAESRGSVRKCVSCGLCIMRISWTYLVRHLSRSILTMNCRWKSPARTCMISSRKNWRSARRICMSRDRHLSDVRTKRPTGC